MSEENDAAIKQALKDEKRRERIQANWVCREGHRLRKGPWGLDICDECTLIFLARYKRDRDG